MYGLTGEKFYIYDEMKTTKGCPIFLFQQDDLRFPRKKRRGEEFDEGGGGGRGGG